MSGTSERLVLPVRGAADFFTLIPKAFRALLARQRAKLRRSSAILKFDAVRCYKTKRGQLRVDIGEPWIAGGTPLPWRDLDDAAIRLRMQRTALVRALERCPGQDVNGVVVKHWKGHLACKLGDSWRICLGACGGTESV